LRRWACWRWFVVGVVVVVVLREEAVRSEARSFGLVGCGRYV
jgi:hypothetical protein